ncbi:possible allantoin transporter, NCS1 family protein [Rhodococcus jostii RHA1]|uniref:Possible allantoin transporter, NCS1 family protein n=1 Tax=Rhodococcus jostii (strain RHA1) TaxID=101510 RepID=Q0S9Y7_RHOJR|nr:possible allantoin transporter, NCS1 family protein [Rhodococcus jostii RHA1]
MLIYPEDPMASTKADPRAVTPGETPRADRAGRVETHGIDFIPDSERHGRARDLFAVWAAPNVSYLALVVGGALILMGLSFWQALAVIVAGNLFSILTGIVAASGPASGTPSEVITRAIFGIRGNRVNILVTSWFISVCYLALNWGGRVVHGLPARRTVRDRRDHPRQGRRHPGDRHRHAGHRRVRARHDRAALPAAGPGADVDLRGDGRIRPRQRRLGLPADGGTPRNRTVGDGGRGCVDRGVGPAVLHQQRGLRPPHRSRSPCGRRSAHSSPACCSPRSAHSPAPDSTWPTRRSRSKPSSRHGSRRSSCSPSSSAPSPTTR